MKVEYSKEFEKAVRKLSGKILTSVKKTILEVKAANKVEELTDCEKLTGYDHVYRIRIGSLRAFFILQVKGDTINFEYLVPRGEAYSKKIQNNLRKKD